MTLRPQSLPPVPEATAAAVQAAFPRGNLYVELRAEFGTLYDDQLFADLYPPAGRPVEVAPWRLALVMVMQYIEGLTDRQAADAVRRCMDWKYALSLDLTDPGFDFTLLHDFRGRLLAHEAAQRFLDTFLAACKARGWVKARGTQRTDSTHVLAAIRTLHRLECVLEAMHYALNQLSDVAPAWVRQQVPPDMVHALWPPVRPDALAEGREQARGARPSGRRGRLSAPGVGRPPRESALVSVNSPPWRRCGGSGCNSITAVRSRGSKTLRWRTGDEQPPAAVRIASPYDLEARYSSKRETHWVGYKLHLTETCDADHPDLITQVMTTPATTQDSVMGPAIQQDLANRDLLPGHTLTRQRLCGRRPTGHRPDPHQIDVVGSAVWVLQPAIGGKGKAMTCRPLSSIGRPSRHAVPKATPVSTGGLDIMSQATRSFASGLTGPPVARVPPAGSALRPEAAPRQLTVRLQAHHEALQAARQRQETPQFKAQYALRAGVESSLSQGIRRFDLRRSRYLGLARTHLQQLLTATAMNVVRVIAWLWGEPLGERRRKPGHFAQLAPSSLVTPDGTLLAHD